MHIPDGYLSPSTCATLYGAAAPFWYVALRRAKRMLGTRMVPLIGLVSAFSFVVMMFNLPLPGGTTGHAVGMGMASIVLGPWISILAISTALLIQALFYGDGGITAFGANCFNMAIVGSLVAYGVYRILSLGSEIRAGRRVLAAGVAGYAAINVAALCAAVEFGIQPALFHDAAGTPLYAPYPLTVAVPAMLIGHLTFAGLAEFVLTAGVVAFLQRSDPALLGRAPSRLPRKLWIPVALALALTPLGIVAAGSAWGEWSPADFSKTVMRQQIAAASRGVAPPLHAPSGLEALSHVWTPPVAGYAPPLIPNASLAYLISAALGVVLILVAVRIAGGLIFRRRPRSFIERTITGLITAAQESLFAEQVSQRSGLLQRMDARVKLAGLGLLIVAAVAARRLEVLLALFTLAMLLAVLSRISLALLVRRVWFGVFVFTGAITIPSVFLVVGRPVFRVPMTGWTASVQGFTAAAFLLLRAETATTFSVLLLLTTPWPRLLRALRVLRVPAVVVVILEMAHRYIFLLLNIARDMLESREARRVGKLEAGEKRRTIAASVGVLLDKSLKLSDEVYASMRARGYRGEVYLLDDLHLTVAQYFNLVFLMGIALAFLWWGR